MDSKRYSAPTARPIRNAADVPSCGMMDRAVGPWWLLRMVSWGDAPGWDGIGPLARKNPPASLAFADGFLGDAPGWDGMGPLARKNPPASRAIWIARLRGDAPGWDGMGPLARKNPPASKNEQSSVDNHQSNLSQKIRGISA